MYGMFGVQVRLATGSGGLKPIWILAPSSLGRYRGVPVSGLLQMVSEHRCLKSTVCEHVCSRIRDPTSERGWYRVIVRQSILSKIMSTRVRC